MFAHQVIIRHSKSNRSRPAIATFIHVEDNPPGDDSKGRETGQRCSALRACSPAHDRPPTRADPSSALGTRQPQTRLLFHDTGVGHELGTIFTPQLRTSPILQTVWWGHSLLRLSPPFPLSGSKARSRASVPRPPACVRTGSVSDGSGAIPIHYSRPTLCACAPRAVRGRRWRRTRGFPPDRCGGLPKCPPRGVCRVMESHKGVSGLPETSVCGVPKSPDFGTELTLQPGAEPTLASGVKAFHSIPPPQHDQTGSEDVREPRGQSDKQAQWNHPDHESRERPRAEHDGSEDQSRNEQ